MTLQTTLKWTGLADVIVVLKPERVRRLAAARDLPLTILRHFVTSVASQDGALLEMLTAHKRLVAPPAAAGATSASLLEAAAKPRSPVRFYPNLGIALGTVDRKGLSGLRQELSVHQVHEAPQLRMIKPVVKAAATTQAGYTWGLKTLGIDQLHARGLSGKGIMIGHLDTGVDGAHPALAGVVAQFAEFDALGNLVPGAAPSDSDEHGTHTAGTIAGQPINGVRFGVAPGAKLASAMVIEGGNVLARILGGLNWIIDQKVRILSMSLGLPGYDEAFLAIVQAMRAHSVLPVFASGNEGPGTSRYPGNYAEALSIGAVGADGLVADFSSSQTFQRATDPIVPDIVSPGVDVISCVPNNNYMQMSGTSMATPHIAGLAALLMEAKPNKTIDEIEAAIFASCNLEPDMLQSRANRGIPDGVKALSLL